MRQTTTKIRVYEIDDIETPARGYPTIDVLNHWNNSTRFVVIEIYGKTYTVEAEDLRQAINNATNY